MKRVTACLAALTVLLACSSTAFGVGSHDATLRDGFYLIVSEHEQLADATADESQYVVSYRRSFEENPEDRTTVYLVLDQAPSIPIQIDGEAQLIEGDKHPILQLTLVDTTREALEAFTRKNLGSGIAIVIGDCVLSTHTIKEVITGGKIQISRCEDDACRYIKARLDKQHTVPLASGSTDTASE